MADRSRRAEGCRILVPQRGDKRALVELATRNAELSYRTRFNETTAAHFDALETLRSRLDLPAIPRRIDCFDISTIQGSETVASMVVCEDGRMKRSEYRKFRDSGSSGLPVPVFRSCFRRPADPDPNPEDPDDPGSRTTSPPCEKSCSGGIARCSRPAGRFPDLILIDGGKGQLSAAYEALERSVWRIWSRSASPRKRSCCSRAIGRSRSCSPNTIRRCCSFSGFATRPTASR